MATNEYNYHPADLIGNVTVPRLTLPTIRSSKRRSDADGTSTVPYYPGINAKKLDIEYTDAALAIQSVSLTIAGTGFASLLSQITALDAVNLEAIDMGGFLGIRNTNSGETHYVKILPQSVPGDEAAGLLGLRTDPNPGSISYAGEIASTPGHRSQENPQGATLISKGDDLNSDAFNRAFVSVIREIEKLRADLERETIGFVEMLVTVQAHEVSTGVKGFYLNDPTLRLPIRDVNPSSDFGFMEGYFTLLDTTYKREVYNGTLKVQGLRVHHANAGTALLTSSGFVTWGTPNGGHIYDPTIPTKIKQASVSISTIQGSVLYCPGAAFETNYVQKNDPVLISSAVNLSPFDHNGWFAVVEVLDEEHIRLRPFGTNENIPAVGPTETPFALNPLGTGFGNLVVYFGDFVPARNMFVSLQNGPGLTNGTYYARIACGRSLREPKVGRPFVYGGDPSAAINDHVTDPTDAHASTAITGFTSATFWYDSSTISGATLKATIEDILTDLSAATGIGGSGLVGSSLITATGFTVPKTLAAGSISSQLLSGLNQLQAHETNSNFHSNYGVISGLGQTSYIYPNLTMAGGTLVASYSGQVREFVVTGQVFALTGNQLYHIYVDLTDGVMKITQTASVAFASTCFPLWYLFTQGFGITWSSDFRVPLASAYDRNRGFVTVGPTGTNSDFPNIADAVDWISWYRGYYAGGPTSVPKVWEIVVQGTVTMDRVSGAFGFPMIIRGAALDASGTPLCKVITPPGTYSHQIGGALSANTTPAGLNNIVIKDLHFETPTSTVTTQNPTIAISASGYELANWLIDNCVFSGGTNAPHISIETNADYSVVPKHITIRDCWFKAATRTSENPHILLKKTQECIIKGCRFEGQTADTFQTGIRLEGSNGAASAYSNMIENCTFDMGGRHIIVMNDVDFTMVKNCISRNSRATAINHLSTGELFLDGHIFTSCMTNSSTAEGVIWSDGTTGRLDIKGCRFKNWATGYAIRAISNTSAGSRISNCFFSATAVNQVVIGFSNALFEGNDFDLSPGASSGNGHDISVVLSILSKCRIVNNAFRNCGSTATSSTDTVIAFNDSNVISGNTFSNCRGTLIQSNGEYNSIFGNVGTDVGTASTDEGVQIGSNNTVALGNVMPHSSSGQPIHVTLSDIKAHVFGNALVKSVATTNASGLAGNAVLKNVLVSIGTTGTVGGNATLVIQTIAMPTTSYGVHIPHKIRVPAKVGTLEAGYTFWYDDGSSETVTNTTGGALDVSIPDFDTVGGMTAKLPSTPNVDRVITRIDLVVRNASATPTSQTMGQIWYVGWVIG